MGFLETGKPLPWSDSKAFLKYVREHGILQFMHIYEKVKLLNNDKLLFGDEIEYHVVKFDHANRNVRVSLRAAAILETLDEREKTRGRTDGRFEGCVWHPEYGSWMVEATPRQPYGGYTSDLSRIEANMRLRRARIMSALEADEAPLSIPAFPLLGVGDFTIPAHKPGGPVTESLYIPDACINPHPRFGTLTANIRCRRGSKVDIRVPVYKDRNTVASEVPAPTADGAPAVSDMYQAGGVAAVGSTAVPHVHMDAMAFGMGCCCLQVTFQASNVGQSRHLYDQLAVLAPIMLALTAATPILKGHLVDTDVRWYTIAASVDDRTPAERGAPEDAPADAAKKPKKKLRKSRYDSVSCYICNHKGGADEHTATDRYNDSHVEVNEAAMASLMTAGSSTVPVDKILAQHVAHLFTRDPLVIFSDKIELDDEKRTDHWENLQSTNWQTVRWKPPPHMPGTKSTHVGWRTEFRSMEVQVTDFENAAFTVFIVLVSRAILAFELNLYIPISSLDANMVTAHKRDAVLEEKFVFRKHVVPPEAMHKSAADDSAAAPEAKRGDAASHMCRHMSAEPGYDDVTTMSVYEILMGKGEDFPGLVPIVVAYLDTIKCDRRTRGKIDRYLTFIVQRASGKVMTAAKFMRHFVKSHPKYKHDSIVSSQVAYDLCKELTAISSGAKQAPSLLGPDVVISPIDSKGAYHIPMSDTAMQSGGRLAAMLRTYQQRAARAEVIKDIESAVATKLAEVKKLQEQLEALKSFSGSTWAANFAEEDRGSRFGDSDSLAQHTEGISEVLLGS